MDSRALPDVNLPKSLEGHGVPEERRAVIEAHVAALAATALGISDTLPLGADVYDFVRVLESEGE